MATLRETCGTVLGAYQSSVNTHTIEYVTKGVNPKGCVVRGAEENCVAPLKKITTILPSVLA